MSSLENDLRELLESSGVHVRSVTIPAYVEYGHSVSPEARARAEKIKDDYLAGIGKTKEKGD